MTEGGEWEWMVMLKTLMTHQAQELKAAVGWQGRRMETMEKTVIANEKKSEKIMTRNRERLDASDKKGKEQMDKTRAQVDEAGARREHTAADGSGERSHQRADV